MDLTGVIQYGLFLLALVLWMVCVAILLVQYERQKLSATLAWVAGLWPFTMVDEGLKLFTDIPVYLNLAFNLEWVSVLIMTIMSLHIHQKLSLRRRRRAILYWLPVIMAVASQIPQFFIADSFKAQLVIMPPFGNPMAYWSIYLPFIVMGFGVMTLSIAMTESLHEYNEHLPEQVADIHLYRYTSLIGVMGTIVGLTFALTVLCIVVTFGIFSIPNWISVFHFCMSYMVLIVMMISLNRRRPSPSPLDYQRLNHTVLGAKDMQVIQAKAEITMIRHKCYKIVGLNLTRFAKMADVDATDLAITLKHGMKSNFRSFVFFYRLEYAKNVLTKSDAKISSVAKRLGFQSEQFLSKVFVKHLANRKD